MGEAAQRVRQKFLSIGTMSLVTANQRGIPQQIKTPKAIVAIHMIGVITITIGTGAGVVQDAIEGYFRQVILENGGSPVQTLGDGSRGASAFQMLRPVYRGWLQAVPHVIQILAANGTFDYHTAFPISVPPNRYSTQAVNRSALRIGNTSTWFIQALAGSIADLITTPGTATVDAASLELIAEVDEDLDNVFPMNGFLMFSNFQRQAIPAATGVQVTFELSSNGIVLFAGYQQRDNSLRSRTVITSMQFRLDGSQIVLEGTWDLFEQILEFFGDSPGNAPVGLAAAIFDNAFDLQGIPAAGSTGWDVLITHGVGTAAAQDGLNGQYFYIRPLGI